MADPPLATFQHPHDAYRLGFPAAWEYRVEKDGQQCGFGPRDRDDVGLWISVLPMRVESEQVIPGLRDILNQSMGSTATDIRVDDSLRHHTLSAPSPDEENGGTFWLIAGGDLVLLASTQFPAAEKDPWEARFARVMASLEITRDKETTALRVRRKLLERLREQFPDASFEAEGDRIRSADQVVYPGNLVRRVLQDPESENAKIAEFVTGLAFVGDDAPSAENLDAVRRLITPMIKPADYVQPDGPTAHVVHRPWLGDLIVCYAIEGDRTLRFVLRKDVERWGIDSGELHDLSIANLMRHEWPEMPGRPPDEEPVILLKSSGGFESRRILDPRLHEMFAPVLGGVFFAALPERDTLILLTGSCSLESAGKVVRQDFEEAAYPITTTLFRVSEEGVTAVEGGAEGS